MLFVCCGLLFSLALLPVTAVQTEANPTVKELSYENEQLEMAYLLYLPEDFDESKTYRLVLFLHGAGDRGYDYETLHRIDYGFITTMLNTEAYAKDTILLVPQCPEPYLWVEDSWAEGAYTVANEPSPATKAAKELVDQTVREYPIDENRIYACGVSMGGMGVWELLARYPGFFAAAAPICGCLDESKIDAYAQTPIFTANDLRDTIVGALPTKRVAETLKAQGADIVYKIYDTTVRQDTTYHSTWIDAFAEDTSENNMYAFLFSRVKTPAPEPTPKPSFTEATKIEQRASWNVWAYLACALPVVIALTAAVIFVNKRANRTKGERIDHEKL